MNLLEAYIKHCIIIEQQHHTNNIIRDIVNKFPSDYNRALAFTGRRLAPPLALAPADNKQNAFWHRYTTDEAFKKLVYDSYAYKRNEYFDFLLLFDELREYLKPELQSAELLLIDRNKASALKISDVSDVLEIAENVEEFKEMIKATSITEHSIKTTIIQESVERRLKINTIISKASKIIMQKLKEFAVNDDDRLSFIITENEIPELKIFTSENNWLTDISRVLYIQVRVKKNSDVRQHSGEYYARENKIIVDLSFKEEDRIERYLHLVIRKLQDTIRHELEHAVQTVKHGSVYSRKEKYHERYSEIEAYAVMIYRRILRNANAFKIKPDELKVIKIIHNFVEKEFHDIDFDERNTLEINILNYMKKRFPLVNKMDMTKA